MNVKYYPDLNSFYSETINYKPHPLWYKAWNDSSCSVQTHNSQPLKAVQLNHSFRTFPFSRKVEVTQQIATSIGTYEKER